MGETEPTERDEIARLEAEVEESDALRERLALLLTRTVNVLRGEPPDNTRWSWHDIPELAEALKAERDNLITERNGYGDMCQELKEVSEKLVAEAERVKVEWQGLFHEWENERSVVIKLNERFACGHRKVDWDDSYGECVFCKTKQQADDYDNLPHEVFQCHDRIEELEATIREQGDMIVSTARERDDARIKLENQLKAARARSKGETNR